MDFNKAYNYCIRLLSIGDRTSYQIVQKLKQKNYSDDVIDETISKLKDYGYINDVKYAERWIEDKSSQPGMSKKSMYYKLIQKGLDKELLNNIFNEISINDYDTALASAQKKLKSLKGDSKTNKVKLFSYLAGKGYSADTCNKVIVELLYED
ncbi:regulatory protein RecX [Lutispora sp.]|uniref:regulatory protein RecX n=1 Tax=Lutispora sp. TaxID=2828727 RepID=UPI002B1F86BD|nr:regulatory protein RecX [Lutispora sp.]MEA4960832.1 regulatory protein RecX [Lutispora sp.]